MKLSFIIFTIFFALKFVSSVSIIDSSSITDDLLCNHLSSIFENIFQQLTEFNEKFSQIIKDKLSRSDPAEWVSQLFNGTNSIGDRSLFDFSLIKSKLHFAVEKLLIKLEQLFVNNINQLWISSIDRNYDILLNTFQQQVSGVFNNTNEQLNQTIDDLIDSILNYWKNRVFLLDSLNQINHRLTFINFNELVILLEQNILFLFFLSNALVERARC